MTDTKWNTKKLVAGTAAVVLTLAAAGAAVAVNLDTADPASSSPAGQLSATEPISEVTAAGTPSTIYVDEVVTVPASPAPGQSPSTAPAPAPAPAAAAGASGSSSSSSSSSYDDDHDRESDDVEDHEDEDREDRDESEHEDGADDDD